MTTPASSQITLGSSAYMRAETALFLAGFASFSLIYCVQPLLPEFARTFRVSPAESALALSYTTGILAVAILLAGAFSQAMGRRGLMFVSMVLAAALNILAALSPSWQGLLASRALEGLAIGGVPAVAMAYLAEEIDPRDLGRAMGLYVAGTAFGGMTGRVGMGLLTEWVSWRFAMVMLGAICMMAATGFMLLLPRSRNFTAVPGFHIGYHFCCWRKHLRNPALQRQFAIGFLLMGVFVTLFNYSTFRLSGEPYGLGQTEISLIFLVYGFGIVSSSAAGSLIGHLGRKRLAETAFALMLAGIVLTLSDSMAFVLSGIVLVTIGFFIGHSVASSAIGPLAGDEKGHAASLYLLFYYLGSSIVGWASGWIWQWGGWPAIVMLTSAMCVTGMTLSSCIGTAKAVQAKTAEA